MRERRHTWQNTRGSMTEESRAKFESQLPSLWPVKVATGMKLRERIRSTCSTSLSTCLSGDDRSHTCSSFRSDLVNRMFKFCKLQLGCLRVNELNCQVSYLLASINLVHFRTIRSWYSCQHLHTVIGRKYTHEESGETVTEGEDKVSSNLSCHSSCLSAND